jgi:pimeloyl-ACP methyl ester carboxylesterase
MREWGDLTSKEQNETLDLVKEVQERLSKEGHTLRNDPSMQPITKHVRHHLEPIMMTHRPLILYMLFWSLEALFQWLWLIPWGFQHHNINNMNYWIKRGLDHEAIVIIHGICRGWSFYWKLIQALGHRRTVVLINYTSIQVNSIPKNYFETANVVDVDEFAETVRHILNCHGLEKVTLICHSYGTFLSTWLLRIIPDRITRVCFVDPLMLTVALYETAYYLFYQEPQTVTDWIYYVFIRSNLPLANVLQRHFVWYNMVIKLDEIPKDIDVCLAYAGQEHLLDPVLMHQLVKCGSNDIIYWDNIHHAECMGNDECVKDIVSWLK